MTLLPVILTGFVRIFLVLLAVLLLILFMVLFLPIRYEISGSLDDKEKNTVFSLSRVEEHFRFELIFSYLFFIRGEIGFPEKKRLCIKAFGVSIYPKEREKSKSANPPSKAEFSSAVHEKNKAEETNNALGKEGDADTAEHSEFDAFPNTENVDGNGDDFPLNEEERKNVDSESGKTHSRRSFRKKLKRYYRILRSEMFRDAVSRALTETVYILHHLLPRKWKVIGTVGFGDPAAAGEVYSCLGLVYPCIGPGHLFIDPEYEDYSADLVFSASGRFYGCCAAAAFIRLILNRNFRTLMHLIRKEK